MKYITNRVVSGFYHDSFSDLSLQLGSMVKNEFKFWKFDHIKH